MATSELRRWAARLRGEPAVVLPSLAAALGLRWTGPGSGATPGVDLGALPAAPAWELLDAAREALLAPGERRRLGAHHTPPELAGRLVTIALDGVAPGATVCDPACGGGAFLVAAALARPDVRLIGVDLDPLAVATTRAALDAAGAGSVRLLVGDGLDVPFEADVVVGNPPFLSPLGTSTGGTPAAWALRAELAAPYLDVAALFLLRAAERAERVVLLQPESLLAARDARVVRQRVGDRLEGLWVAGEPVFEAAVRVCAPVLTAAAGGTVRRWQGRGVRPVRRVPRPGPASWAALRGTSAPRVRVAGDAGRIGDLATATAGFRDEFYAVAAAVRDGGEGAPVVTSGLVDPGRVAWGERPARIAGRTYRAPTVDPADLDGRVAAWLAGRLVPKVLVATQTKVIEAAADPDGRFVPLTPVLAVTPLDGADPWMLAAALTSPAATVWALQTYGGAALSGEAIKLSAKQVLELPLPADAAAWAEATARLRSDDVGGCGAALTAGDDRLLHWWAARLPTTARTV